MDLNLKGRTAVVCGSTQGIGHAVAIELASLGANVVLFARNAERLAEVVTELDRSQDQRHAFLAADFMEPAQVKMAIEPWIQAGGRAQILVNNTGGPPAGPIVDARPQDFLEAFQAHLINNHILAQALLPGMKDAGFGRIVNIISTSVKQPIPGLGVSNTTRGAVASWSKTLATEVAPFGITVNNVLPGMTRTGRLESIIQSRAEKSGRSAEEIDGRFAEPHEIAAAAAFLCTPAAAYINGTNITVDGGRTLCL